MDDLCNKIESVEGSNEIIFNAKKIRSQWRRALIIYFSTFVGLSMIQFVILHYSENDEVAHQVVVEASSMLFFSALSLLIMYYFAYVKLGTKWIGFVLIATPFSVASDLFFEFKEVLSSPTSNIEDYIILLAISLAVFLLTAYFWINSKRLYDLNKAIKLKKMEVIKSHKQSFVQI